MADSTTTYNVNNSTVLSQSPCWNRVYCVKVYQHQMGTIISSSSSGSSNQWTEALQGDTVLQISNYNETTGELIPGDNIRCSFDVQRYAIGQPNIATIKLYNLTADAETQLIVEGYRVVVSAGYQQNPGEIFDGFVVMASRTKENGTDYTLTLQCMDGYHFLTSAYCSYTVNRGATARELLTGIASKASVPITIGHPTDSDSSVLDGTIYSRGFSVYGLAHKMIEDLAKTHNATWYVDNGKLYLIGYNETTSNLPIGEQAVELSPSTGLLGNPLQIEYGVSAKSFINPKIAPYCFVHINPEYITAALPQIGSNGEVSNSEVYTLDTKGLYRVVSCEFVGDTRSNDWYVQFSAYTQSGRTPQQLAGVSNGTMN